MKLSEAESNLNNARAAVKDLVRELHELVVNNALGYDQFTKEQKEILSECHIAAASIHKLLG